MSDIPPQVIAQMLAQMPSSTDQEAMQLAQATPTHQVVDAHTGQVVGTYSSLKRAHTAADKRDQEYGAVRYIVKPIIAPVVKPILGNGQ